MVSRPTVMRAGCGLVLAGLLVVAVRTGGWSLVVHATLHVGPPALAIALAATLISMTLSGVVWARVLRCLGDPAPVRVGLTVYAATGLAAYIGTSAGAVGGCVVLLRKRGVCAGRAALLMGIASVLAFCGSMIWAPCGVALLAAPRAIHALPALGTHGPLVAIVTGSVCVVGALVTLWLATVAPRLGPRWRVARLIGDPSAPPLRIHLRHLLALIPLASIAWLVGTGPLWVLVQAAAPGVQVSLSAVIAVQSVAALVGAVTFFLPNGLGARDGTMVALLAGIVGVPIPAAAAAVLLVRVGDPVTKALILLALATLRRIPATAWQSLVSWLSPIGAMRALHSRVVLATLRSDPTAS